MRIWWVAALAACSGVSAEPSPDHDRFRGVKKWVGTYKIQLSGVGNWKETETTKCTTTVKTAESKLNRTTSVQITFDEVDDSDAQILWSGRAKVVSNTDFSYSSKTVFTDRCGGTNSTSSESGTLKSKPGMDGDLEDGGNIAINFE